MDFNILAIFGFITTKSGDSSLYTETSSNERKRKRRKLSISFEINGQLLCNYRT